MQERDSHLALRLQIFPLLSQIRNSRVEHLGILFFYIFRPFASYFPAEAENPAKEERPKDWLLAFCYFVRYAI